MTNRQDRRFGRAKSARRSAAQGCAAVKLLLHGIGSEKSTPIKVAEVLAADPGDRCSRGKCYAADLRKRINQSDALRDLVQSARRDNEWALWMSESNKLNDPPGDGGHDRMAHRAVDAELKAVPAVHYEMASRVAIRRVN